MRDNDMSPVLSLSLLSLKKTRQGRVPIRINLRSVGQPIDDYPCDDSFHSSVGSKLCIFIPKGQRK